MIIDRTLLRLRPALLLTLLFAAAPAVALPSPKHDAAVAVSDTGAHSPKLADHASKKPRPRATLEEFFEIDDDAEQDFKPQPLFAHDGSRHQDRQPRSGSFLLRCASHPSRLRGIPDRPSTRLRLQLSAVRREAGTKSHA